MSLFPIRCDAVPRQLRAADAVLGVAGASADHAGYSPACAKPFSDRLSGRFPHLDIEVADPPH